MARKTFAQARTTASMVEALAPLVSGENPDGSAFTLPTSAAPPAAAAASTAGVSWGSSSVEVVAANTAAI
jgi:hypothetical protein